MIPVVGLFSLLLLPPGAPEPAATPPNGPLAEYPIFELDEWDMGGPGGGGADCTNCSTPYLDRMTLRTWVVDYKVDGKGPTRHKTFQWARDETNGEKRAKEEAYTWKRNNCK
jgi:hypothetical protein